LEPESQVVPYLNRLADLCWTLARWQEGEFRPARAASTTP
jgi:cob(I)alamin adenosyltransferase